MLSSAPRQPLWIWAQSAQVETWYHLMPEVCRRLHENQEVLGLVQTMLPFPSTLGDQPTLLDFASDWKCAHPSELLTAKASWNSKTSMSCIVRPAFSSTLGVAYVGLREKEAKSWVVVGEFAPQMLTGANSIRLLETERKVFWASPHRVCIQLSSKLLHDSSYCRFSAALGCSLQ